MTITEGILNIRAERQEKEEHKDKDRFRSEFRYGSFSRSIPLPEGVNEEDIKASYTDGVLEVRAPLPEKTIQHSTEAGYHTRLGPVAPHLRDAWSF